MFVVLLLVATVLQQMRHTGVLQHCSYRVRLWNQYHLCFYSSKSQLAFSLACYSSRGSHAARCGMPGAGPRLPTQRQSNWRGFTWETQGKQTSMQMESVKAGKIIEFILIYRTINWFVDYHDGPNQVLLRDINVAEFHCYEKQDKPLV